MRSVSLTVLSTLLAFAATAPVVAETRQELLEDLARARAGLVERTREYKASLEKLLAIQEQDARRASELADKRRELLAAGIVSRRELDETERAAGEAHGRVEETRRRIVEADLALAEAQAAIALAELPPPKPEEVAATRALIRYAGSGTLTPAEIDSLERFFTSRFGRALPVSARGQTPVHDRLGLDHRHAVDLAVHPDSNEGQALIAYLKARRIPFLGFREAMAGASTGAHLHVGRPSDRLAGATR
jgi:hypothetical protein